MLMNEIVLLGFIVCFCCCGLDLFLDTVRLSGVIVKA